MRRPPVAAVPLPVGRIELTEVRVVPIRTVDDDHAGTEARGYGDAVE
jgi:hypothetical protein